MPVGAGAGVSSSGGEDKMGSEGISLGDRAASGGCR